MSAGFAVPVFAFFSAGVMLGGMAGLKSALADPIAIGIIAGLVVGKPIGILIATFITAKVTRQPLQKGLTWPDVTGVAILGGIGFTVSLLIGELAFGGNSEADDHVKIAVLPGSVARRGDRRRAAADPQQALPGVVGGREPGRRSRRDPGHLPAGVVAFTSLASPANRLPALSRSRPMTPSRRALIRRPSPRLADGLVTHIDRVAGWMWSWPSSSGPATSTR